MLHGVNAPTSFPLRQGNLLCKFVDQIVHLEKERGEGGEETGEAKEGERAERERKGRIG